MKIYYQLISERIDSDGVFPVFISEMTEDLASLCEVIAIEVEEDTEEFSVRYQLNSDCFDDRLRLIPKVRRNYFRLMKLLQFDPAEEEGTGPYYNPVIKCYIVGDDLTITESKATEHFILDPAQD